MYFGFDEDQIAVRDAVAGLLEKRAGLAYLQAAWADPTSEGTWSVWRELAGMGVQGLLLPEAAGGTGFDWVTLALVLCEAGRVALPLPLVETAAVAAPVLHAAGDPTGVLDPLLAGDTVVTVADRAGSAAPAAGRAEWFIIGGDGGHRLYRRDQVEVTAEQSVDRTRDLGRVTPTGPGVPLDVTGAAAPVAAHAGALATAAVLIGLGRALVDITVAYVKDRKQFGVPVGSFQAVKHHLADATMHVEFAAPPVWAAAYQLAHPGDHSGEQVARAVSLAKAMASDAATLAARKALQCHGAMGYTDDYHLHLWLKRVWCLAAAYGTAGEHRRLIGAGLGVAG